MPTSANYLSTEVPIKMRNIKIVTIQLHNYKHRNF